MDRIIRGKSFSGPYNAVRVTKEDMKSFMTVLFLSTIPIPDTFAAGPGDPEDRLFWKIVLIAVSVVLTGVIGYFIGTVKFFREAKHKAYGEMIPPILKMAYHPQDAKDKIEDKGP
jgi:hypothetical protein